jgi:hypothetical protein
VFSPLRNICVSLSEVPISDDRQQPPFVLELMPDQTTDSEIEGRIHKIDGFFRPQDRTHRGMGDDILQADPRFRTCEVGVTLEFKKNDSFANVLDVCEHCALCAPLLTCLHRTARKF